MEMRLVTSTGIRKWLVALLHSPVMQCDILSSDSIWTNGGPAYCAWALLDKQCMLQTCYYFDFDNYSTGCVYLLTSWKSYKARLSNCLATASNSFSFPAANFPVPKRSLNKCVYSFHDGSGTFLLEPKTCGIQTWRWRVVYVSSVSCRSGHYTCEVLNEILVWGLYMSRGRYEYPFTLRTSALACSS